MKKAFLIVPLTILTLVAGSFAARAQNKVGSLAQKMPVPGVSKEINIDSLRNAFLQNRLLDTIEIEHWTEIETDSAFKKKLVQAVLDEIHNIRKERWADTSRAVPHPKYMEIAQQRAEREAYAETDSIKHREDDLNECIGVCIVDKISPESIEKAVLAEVRKLMEEEWHGKIIGKNGNGENYIGIGIAPMARVEKCANVINVQHGRIVINIIFAENRKGKGKK
ncbi:MAG: hypothetical protein ABIH83_03705 [Candidatus Micrarchaeota archaeon]